MSEKSSGGTDRNLLFGVLALQLNFIDRDALVAAMNAWVLAKQRTLGEILAEQGRLLPAQREALDALIGQHLAAHGGNAERSLRACVDGSTAIWTLRDIADPDVQQSVGRLSDADATKTFVPSPPSGARFVRGQFHKGGGLGDVYHARDQELHREVALKEIKPRFADDLENRQRFVVEAEITGGLEHPGIVPVYGLGEYKDGRPHYAMRFIRGESMRDAIEEHHATRREGESTLARERSLRQLLRRFVDVCNAVAYAHSRGVVHCDLKPSNVMLGKFGETLVVDWGLAEAGHEPKAAPDGIAADPVLRPSSGSNRQPTSGGEAVGTIPYMSPEQALGRRESLGAASDIYSLGSTLYTLLTGRRPYEGRDNEELLAKVQRGEFSPTRSVKGDVPKPLDAICLKAMAYRPEDRYATALDLAADLDRWLDDEKVRAYDETWQERSSRWMRRHRTAAVSMAAVLVTAVIGLAVTVVLVAVEQRETERQRRLAVESFQKLRGQSVDIVRLIESSEPELASIPYLHERREELLKTTAATCELLLSQNPEDEELQRHAAQIYRYAANFHRLINRAEEAERYYESSRTLREAMLARHAKDVGVQLALAELHRDQAALDRKLGRLKEASARFESALAVGVRSAAAEPQVAAYRRATALYLMNLADVDARRGVADAGPEGPTARLEGAILRLRSLVDGPESERQPLDSLLLGAALNIQGSQWRKAGKLREADAAHREAIKLLTPLATTKSRHVNPADVKFFMAQFRLEHCKTQFASGAESARKTAHTNSGVAINQLVELSNEYPKIPQYREALAAALRERGDFSVELGDLELARDHFTKSAALLGKLAGEHPRIPQIQAELALAYRGLAQVASQDEPENAAAWRSQAAAALNKAIELSPDEIEFRSDLSRIEHDEKSSSSRLRNRNVVFGGVGIVDIFDRYVWQGR